MRSAHRAGVVCKNTIGRSGGVVESREALIASELATNRAAIVDKRAVTRGRALVEYRGALSECTLDRWAVVGKSAMARAR
jgi:hypothetical protein